MNISLAKAVLSVPEGWKWRNYASWQNASSYESPDGDKVIVIFNDGSRMLIDGTTGMAIINPDGDLSQISLKPEGIKE